MICRIYPGAVNLPAPMRNNTMAGLMKRVGRKLREVYGGKNTYMPKKSVETARTKTVSGGLKQAGLTDKEIAKLRGKK